MQSPGEFELDVRGALCPRPIVDLAACMRRLPVGAIVTLYSDDLAITLDLPAWCESAGHELLGITREGRSVRGRVRKLHDRL